MIIKISDYKCDYEITRVYSDDRILNEIRENEEKCLFFNGENLIKYPENKKITLNENEACRFSELGNGSVLEIKKGEAYVAFDPKLSDNALFVTNQCNSNCIMCPVSEKQRRTDEIAPINTLLEICSRIPNFTHHITITGGEPFLLKKDFFVLMDYLKNNLNNVEYLLLTNGRALSDIRYFREFIRTVPPDLIIGIPIHGYDEQTHDKITRTRGSFIQTYKALKLLLNEGQRVELRIVVSNLNIGILDKIVDLIISEFRNVYTVKFIGLEMLGTARKNIVDVWVDYRESFKFMKSPIVKLVENEINVGIYNYPLCCVDHGFWSICEKSITENKVRFLEECEQCSKKDACGGMFQGTYKLMNEVVKAIK